MTEQPKLKNLFKRQVICKTPKDQCPLCIYFDPYDKVCGYFPR